MNKSAAFSKSTVRKRSKKKMKYYYTSHLHSVDSDIFYAMIHLPAHFRDLHLPLFLKVESNQGVLPKLRFKSTPPTSNNALSEHWVGFLCSLAPTQKTRTTQWCDIPGVLLEAGTQVLAPVSSEHSTRLRRNEVSSRQIRNQKLD